MFLSSHAPLSSSDANIDLFTAGARKIGQLFDDSLMACVTPQTTPSIGEKRKRQAQDEGPANESSTSRPNRSPSRETPDTASKRQRVVGPTLPPASLDDMPAGGPEKDQQEDESSDDDSFGPALPSGKGSEAASGSVTIPVASTGPQVRTTTTRDEWMIVPPSNGDWTARIDPTKLKNRKFNTGKGAKGPAQSSARGDDASWHETPAEKQARVQREMMGIRDDSRSRDTPPMEKKIQVAAEKVKEYVEKSRGKTLYDEHQKSNPQEDDPSARAFDREKDIAGGMKINTTQRREMMSRATDFGSRFSSARYL